MSVALLVGMQIGATIVGSSMEIPPKIKSGTALWPSNSTSGNISKKPETLIWKTIGTPVFIAALFTIAKIWKQPRCPSWVDKKAMVHVHNSIPFSHKKKEIVTLVLLSIFHSHGDLNSLKTVAGAIIGIITFIYCPSRATALHCCISSVLQTFFLTKFIGWHWLMKLYI